MNTYSASKLGQTEKHIEINRELCKGCGICVAFCPKKILELDEHEKAKVINPDECQYCGLCELRCPDLAIEIIK
jgi:2-oxoglutarate ferredoxin oxidoreductase subunit delta